jgi:hypothetical protein
MTEDEELAVALAMSAEAATSSTRKTPVASSSAGASASASATESLSDSVAALGAAVPSIESKQKAANALLPDPLVAEDVQPANKACAPQEQPL